MEHLGPNDYYYWDNYWGIAGLQSAAQLCRSFASDKKMNEFLKAAEDFKRTVDHSIYAIPEIRKQGGIPASPNRRMDSGAIGSMVADYPLQLTSPGNSEIQRGLNIVNKSGYLTLLEVRKFRKILNRSVIA